MTNYQNEVKDSCKESTVSDPQYTGFSDYSDNKSTDQNREETSAARSENCFVKALKPQKRSKGSNYSKSFKYGKKKCKPLSSFKSPISLKLSKGKYFNFVQEESKQDLMFSCKVDPFNAELALFITDGDYEASKVFLTS